EDEIQALGAQRLFHILLIRQGKARQAEVHRARLELWQPCLPGRHIQGYSRVRKDDIHACRSATIRELNSLKLCRFKVRELSRLMHHRAVFVPPVRQLKGHRTGSVGSEGSKPQAFKIDRIGENTADARGQIFPAQERLDPAPGRAIDPLVDAVCCARVARIECLCHRGIELLEPLQEVWGEGQTTIGPDPIRYAELALGTPLVEGGPQRPKSLFHFLYGGLLSSKSARLFLPRLSRRAVVC